MTSDPGAPGGLGTATAGRLRSLGRPETARSRADQLADFIGHRIATEQLPVGSPVGTLEELREQTGFARATVSEAVRLLRDRGVVDIRPGRGGGLFVTDRNPVVRLRHTLLSVQEQPTTVMDAIELRDHLESLIDLSAARFSTQTDVTELKAVLSQMRTATTWPEFMRANWALHERIALICPNAMARAVYIGTLGHLSATTASRVAGDAEADYQRKRYLLHEMLVDAIASADEDVVLEAVRQHSTTID